MCVAIDLMVSVMSPYALAALPCDSLENILIKP